MSQRKHGRSDMFSIGLLILYTMCDTCELFYRLRDNYVKPEETWLAKLRSEELIINLVIKMMKLELTVNDAQQYLADISNDIKKKLTKSLLCEKYKVPDFNLDVQDRMDECTVNLVAAPILDKYVPITTRLEN